MPPMKRGTHGEFAKRWLPIEIENQGFEELDWDREVEGGAWVPLRRTVNSVVTIPKRDEQRDKRSPARKQQKKKKDSSRLDERRLLFDAAVSSTLNYTTARYNAAMCGFQRDCEEIEP